MKLLMEPRSSSWCSPPSVCVCVRVQSPGVVQHHSGEVLAGLGQIGHGEAERGEKATLKQADGILVRFTKDLQTPFNT